MELNTYFQEMSTELLESRDFLIQNLNEIYDTFSELGEEKFLGEDNSSNTNSVSAGRSKITKVL